MTGLTLIEAGFMAASRIVNRARMAPERPSPVLRAHFGRDFWMRLNYFILVGNDDHFEEIMILTDKLATVGRLSGAMAHEINTPLSYVGITVEMMKDLISENGHSMSPILRQEMETYLLRISEGVNHIRSVVKNLKLFLHPGQPIMGEVGKINLRKAVESAVQMLCFEIRHRAKVNINLPESLEVIGDESCLSQVFVNLLTNALDSLAEGPLEENRIEIEAEAPAKSPLVIVRVHDNGCGIDPALFEKIFAVGFTTKKRGQGTGLGLPICKQIVEKYGGRINLRSEVGKGSTFYLTLRLA